MLNSSLTCSSDRTSSRLRATIARHLRLLNCCLLRTIYRKCAAVKLVSATTLTSVLSPSSDHACIHKCKSDVKCLNYPLSLLPSQFLGMKSLIRYSYADTLCNGVAMRFNMSNLPLTASFSSVRICPFLSQLLLKNHQVCCGARARAVRLLLLR